MARRQFGIRTIFLCTKGTLLTTPTNVVVAGYRGECNLTIEDFNEIKSVLNQNLGNMKNFKIETPTFQAKLEVFKNLHTLISTGADAQLISVPQVAGAVSSGGIFNMYGNNNPGLGFELLITPKERSIKLTLEVAMPEDEALEIITESLTNVPKNLSTFGSGAYGVNAAKRALPKFISAYNGNGFLLADRDELMDYKISIKTKDSGKNAYNKDQVNYYSILFEITGSDATISNIYNQTLMNRDAELVVLQNDGVHDDEFHFNTGVLGRKDKIEIGDTKGALTLSYEADIPVPDVSIIGTDPHLITFGV